MTNAPPLGGLSSYQAAARAHGSVEEAVRFLRRLARIEHRTLLVWWSDFYAGLRKQST